MFATFDLVVDKVDSVDGVDRPHERPLRISIPLIYYYLLFRCGQSGQCGRCGQASGETSKILKFL